MMAAVITKRRMPARGGRRPYLSLHIETETHVADTALPVFSQAEFLRGDERCRGYTILGIYIKPHVRVKMARA